MGVRGKGGINDTIHTGVRHGGRLIVAIGAQNAFVLTQGVRRNHHLAVAALCILCDGLLIGLGVTGVGTVVASNPDLGAGGGLGRAALSGLVRIGRAAIGVARRFHGGAQEVEQGLKRTLALTLAVTLLNPHVYLDTVVLMGSVSGQFQDTARYVFGLGRVRGLDHLVPGPESGRSGPGPAVSPRPDLACPGRRGLPDHVDHRRLPAPARALRLTGDTTGRNRHIACCPINRYFWNT